MFVKVKASFSDFEPGWQDELELLSVRVPIQKNVRSALSPEALAAAGAAAESTSTATGATLAVNVVLSGAMAQVWGMINGMQLIVNLPLFDMVFPSFSQEAVTSLITITTFEVMPTDEIFATIDAPEEEQENPNFASVGYEAISMILNLGTMFLSLLVMMLIPILLLVTKPCKKKSRWLTKRHTGLTKSLHGNMFIRYLLEGCLDIAICSVLDVVHQLESENGLEWSTFQVINNLTIVILGIAVMIFPAWVFIFYCKNFTRWNDADFKSKYGSVFEGLRKDRRSALAYPLIFLVRRSVIVIIAILTPKMFFVQLTVMVGISIGQISYLLHCQPFVEPLLLKLEIFNEVVTIILLDLLTLASAGNNSPIDLETDIMFLLCLIGNVAVHIYFLVKDSVKVTRVKCRIAMRKGCCCRKKEQDRKAVYKATAESA